MPRSKEWRKVVGFEEFYEVSSLGRVRRSAPARGTQVGKILGIRHDRCGYVQVLLHGDHLAYRTVHSLVAEAFLGPRSGREVNHKNRVRDDNRVDNLEWISHAENVPLGEQHGNSRLTEKAVQEIRRVRGRVVQRVLAHRFGVSQGLISQVQCGKVWAPK